MDEKRKPGYFAVIPAAVRYCQSLPPNAKLLYGDISALSNALGYCWASDEFFCRVYELHPKTIRNLLSALEKEGFIIVQEERAEGQFKVRKIALNPIGMIPSSSNVPGGTLEKIFPEMENNFPDLEKIFREYIKNNNKSNNPPKSPPKGGMCDTQSEEWFETIWKDYSAHAKTPGSKKRAKAAWKKLNPDEDLVRRICGALRKQYKTDRWKRGFDQPHFSTWLNQEYWENQVVEGEDGQAEETAPRKTGWD